ncbi:unnamed protein product, partial [Cylicostephanus goldi]
MSFSQKLKNGLSPTRFACSSSKTRNCQSRCVIVFLPSGVSFFIGLFLANEEVIAESYDSADAKDKKASEANSSGAPGCPNKYNPYHLCTEYCYDHWREGTPENRLSESYLRKRKRMLAKFPLPEPWVEVYDAGVARHYYWNQDTDEVCWVSPRHPIAVIGEAAPRVAKELK